MTDWDKRYKEGFYDGAKEPHELLKRFWKAMPGGHVIDIAMGNGRDIAFLAEKGFHVHGIDRSMEAIKIARQTSGLKTSLIHGDAASLPFKHNSAGSIIVFYFLLRDIMREINDILKKGGLLIYETYLKRQNNIDTWRNPDFLLDDAELISYFRMFDVLFYEEIISEKNKGKKKAIARFVGRKK